MQEKIYVTKSKMPSLEEYVNEISSIWDTHWLTNMGEKHVRFQEKLEEYLEVNQVELLVNGHMALEMTLQAMELSGEVITTPFTFASTTHAIIRNGLKPVFCDIDPISYTIDVNRIEELITEKTCAIMPVHVYGNICDVEAIDEIAKRHKLKVIYDAAHAFGVKYKGKGIGTFGDASVFSFHATKVMNSIEGGAVCCNENSLADKLYNLKNFGIRGPEDVETVGANAKMNEFCAAMGLCNLRHVDEEIDDRRRVIHTYTSELAGVDGIVLNHVQGDVVHNNAYFPILIDNEIFGSSRDLVVERLAEENIFARKYFYPLVSDFECYRSFFDSNETPIAKRIANQVMTLPLYGELEEGIIKKICAIILSCKK